LILMIWNEAIMTSILYYYDVKLSNESRIVEMIMCSDICKY